MEESFHVVLITVGQVIWKKLVFVINGAIMYFSAEILLANLF